MPVSPPPGILIQGTSTGNNKNNIINDVTKTFIVDQYMFKSIIILSGTGENQTRKILRNSETTIIIDRDWAIIPDNTSVYAVFPVPPDLSDDEVNALLDQKPDIIDGPLTHDDEEFPHNETIIKFVCPFIYPDTITMGTIAPTTLVKNYCLEDECKLWDVNLEECTIMLKTLIEIHKHKAHLHPTVHHCEEDYRSKCGPGFPFFPTSV